MGGTFTEEFGDVASGLKGFAGDAFNYAGRIGGGLWDAATSEAGNPVAQGLAGIMAFTLAWTVAPKLLQHVPGLGGDGFLGRTSRGLLGIGLAAVVGMGAAAGMGMARDDGPGNNSRRQTQVDTPVESARETGVLNRPPTASLTG